MRREPWLEAVDRRWRQVMVVRLMRRYPGVLRQDCEEAVCSALYSLHVRFDSHRVAVAEVAGPLFVLARWRLLKRLRYYRRQRRRGVVSVGDLDRSGLRVRLGCDSLYVCVEDAAEVVGRGVFLGALREAVEAGTVEEPLARRVAEVLGCSEKWASNQLWRFRREVGMLVGGLCRGPSGRPVDGHVQQRGRTVAAVEDYRRRVRVIRALRCGSPSG